VIIAAHPDDEVLWFSSVLKKAEAVFICFTNHRAEEVSRGRKKSLSEYPIPGVRSLGVTEAGVHVKADWNKPATSAFGMKLRAEKPVRRAYEENFSRLRDHFSRILEGVTNVFTHNPWGEYGHAEHVQVYRAVKSLQSEIGFSIWFPAYCSYRSLSLMQSHPGLFGNDHRTLKTDRELAMRIKELYMRNGCWTWFSDWKWPEEEFFIHEAPESGASHDGGFQEGVTSGSAGFSLLPFNFIMMTKPPGRMARLAHSLKLSRLKEKVPFDEFIRIEEGRNGIDLQN
jgi:LmbE family N-acetylglucosaminyl deacetylase